MIGDYKMAYINATHSSQIRKALKEKYPDFKFRVKIFHHTSILVELKKSPIDFSNILEGADYIISLNKIDRKIVNEYYLDRYLNHEQLFTEIIDVIKYSSDNKWYDKSDIMTDYFNTAFYFNLRICA